MLRRTLFLCRRARSRRLRPLRSSTPVKGIPTTIFVLMGEDTYLFPTIYCSVRMFPILQRKKDSNLILLLADKSHPSEQVIRNRQYWLAHLSNVSQETTRANLELIEHALIYTCQTDVNKSKKASHPKKPVVVINRWLTIDGYYRERRISPVQKAVPDIILFDGENFWTCEQLKFEQFL